MKDPIDHTTEYSMTGRFTKRLRSMCTLRGYCSIIAITFEVRDDKMQIPTPYKDQQTAGHCATAQPQCGVSYQFTSRGFVARRVPDAREFQTLAEHVPKRDDTGG